MGCWECGRDNISPEGTGHRKEPRGRGAHCITMRDATKVSGIETNKSMSNGNVLRGRRRDMRIKTKEKHSTLNSPLSARTALG